ncbi:hypothetical protein [Roseobacter sp. N2S]|uniref:hypothetical protein n=1 Tax=Roseobacter sp. N2S TaxID=2663844 RepID=UPI0028620E24|nr:hypothetical protein [Roseobacter sp. N2S]MDR6266538.1 hypothetical protein [Roseobacter sp. N2S]
MCEPVTAALSTLFAGGAGATAAAGATGLAGLGSTISTIGTIASVGGALYQGISSYKAGKAQSEAYAQQAATEQAIKADESEQFRRRMKAEIAKQRLEFGARGIGLASPTAIALGEDAARELSFGTQSIVEQGTVRAAELSAAGKASRARGRTALLGGGFSAASSVLSASADRWQNLYGEEVDGMTT